MPTAARSQNGWPALEPNSSLLYTWLIPIKNRPVLKLRMRNGSAGFILAYLILRLAETVVGLNRKADDWGYAYRPIRGYTTTLSNHSSGTAADLDATDHPLGKVGTWGPRHAANLRLLLARPILRNTVRWGGDYHGRKDEMHLEINAPLAKCERVARRLMRTPRGKRILAANPTQAAVILS